MTRCLSTLGGCLADCLFVTARTLLFCSCLMIAIVHTAYILLPRHDQDQDLEQDPFIKDDDKTAAASYTTYFMSGIMLGLALCGLYGTFTRDSRSLKLFALLVTILALIYGAGLYSRHSENSFELAKFNATMKKAADTYNWSPASATNSINMATTLWDTAQTTLECCGLVDRSQWFDHHNKPAHLLPDVMPNSCCSNLARARSKDGQCYSVDAFKVGCSEQYRKALVSSLTMGILDNLFYISLAILALYVAEYKNNSRRPTTVQYTQFDGSIYMNRPHHQQRQQAFYEKPPAYVTTISSSAPPPSYSFA